MYSMYLYNYMSILCRDALCQSLELVELIIKGITSILPAIDGPVVDGWLVTCNIVYMYMYMYMYYTIYIHVCVMCMNYCNGYSSVSSLAIICNLNSSLNWDMCCHCRIN